jgi:hypothetical protein
MNYGALNTSRGDGIGMGKTMGMGEGTGIGMGIRMGMGIGMGAPSRIPAADICVWCGLVVFGYFFMFF